MRSLVSFPDTVDYQSIEMIRSPLSPGKQSQINKGGKNTDYIQYTPPDLRTQTREGATAWQGSGILYVRSTFCSSLSFRVDATIEAQTSGFHRWLRLSSHEILVTGAAIFLFRYRHSCTISFHLPISFSRARARCEKVHGGEARSRAPYARFLTRDSPRTKCWRLRSGEARRPRRMPHPWND